MASEKGSKERRRATLSDSAKVEIRRFETRADVVSKLGHSVAKYGSIVGIAYWGYRSIDSLAGQETVADIAVTWLASCKFTGVLAAVLTISAMVYGHYQRKLRKDVVERMHEYQVRYETARDSKRTSSKLTPRGDTRQEDL